MDHLFSKVSARPAAQRAAWSRHGEELAEIAAGRFRHPLTQERGDQQMRRRMLRPVTLIAPVIGERQLVHLGRREAAEGAERAIDLVPDFLGI